MEEVYMRAGKVMIPVQIEDMGDTLAFAFGFNGILKDHLKVLQGSRWEPNSKRWTVPKSPANNFQIAHLKGEPVYQQYDQPLIETAMQRSAYKHQREMFWHGATRRACIIAGEMGTGKTLVAIELMELVSPETVWYVAPRATLVAIELELWKWKANIKPVLMTYEELVKRVKNWKAGDKAPQMIIGDEISKCKNHRSQRTQAMQHVADGIRKDWGKKAYILLMSGSPAPKSPSDWWSLCNIACPGFLRETNFFKFEARLSIQQQFEGADGVKFNKILSWKDNVAKCSRCAKERRDFIHSEEAKSLDETAHDFIGCENEIEKLHRRLNGLVMVKFKKDCLDLPEKIYRTIKVKPSLATMNAARLLTVATTGANLLIKLRELSDGFQYEDIRGPDKTCPRCEGTGETVKIEDAGAVVPSYGLEICHACNGSKVIQTWVQTHKEVDCPKDQAVLDLLEEFEEDGRIVFYAGFTPSIDRLVRLCKSQGWNYVRVDGRGWDSDFPFADNQDLLRLFQERPDVEKVAFIGHPGSAGMGLTLTASKAICYYSNDFNAESRIQSEDRIHRLGSRGANIIDLIHLPTDQKVLDSLKAKRDLQSISLGELKDELQSGNDSDR